jgi:predicted dehydrogenase
VEARLSWPLRFGSLEELLRGADVEVLLVSTPPSTHAEAAVRAAEAGLHVLVEKPMALDPGEGVRMVRAASQAQRRLQVGFSRRFRAPYQRLRERLGRMESRQVKEARFELAFPTASWRAQTDFLGDPARGGGVLDDVLSHQVDLICWMLGRPDEVKAELAPSPDGAVRAELRIGGVNVGCTAAHAGYAERLEVELVAGGVLEASGSRLRSGSGGFPGWRRRRALLMDRASLISDRLLGRANITLASFETQLRDFERAIRGGSSDGASGEDGLLAIDIVEACRTSARNGGAWQRLKLSARPAA